jgi:hypothetical protein
MTTGTNAGDVTSSVFSSLTNRILSRFTILFSRIKYAKETKNDRNNLKIQLL